MERFEDKFAFSNSWINQVTKAPKINSTGEAIHEFAEELLTYRETLHAIDCLGEINKACL